MGVYIKGMEMPKSCYVCPFCDYVSARCDAVKGNPYTPESRYEKRADFCPLVHVPAHGRLIDADALYSHIKDEQRKCNDPYDGWSECQIALGFVNTAPTIIPADKEG